MKGQLLMPKRSATGSVFSQKGQAAIEYILVLSVVVLIALGLLAQFNSGFESWVRNYYGSYLSCLLETGELPTLGYDGAEGECEEEFVPFTLAGGRAPRPSNIPPGVGPDGETSQAENNNQESDREKKPPAGDGDLATSGAGSDGSSAAAGISAGPQLMGDDEGRKRKVPLSLADLGKGGGRSGGTQYDSVMGMTSNSDSSGRPVVVPAPGFEDETLRESAKKPNVPAAAEDLSQTRRVPADVAKAKKKVPESEGWSFPDFLRFLLIAGIIIAMLVFFGGQALQISKGSEK